MLQLVKKHSAAQSTRDNLIIQGDSSVVLPKLKEDYQEQVDCVYLDPPYNNGEKYHHYNDKNSDASWLGGIEEVLEGLWPLLKQNGSVWISSSDEAVHYLKVKADQVLGRDKFVTSIVWQQRTTRENRRAFSNNHEHILVYAKNEQEFKKRRNKIDAGKEMLERYKNPDNDPKGPWQSVSLNVQAGHATANQFYEFEGPSGKLHSPPNGRCWVMTKKRLLAEVEAGNIWFGISGDGVPRRKKYLNGNLPKLTPDTIWHSDVTGTNKSAKKHLLKMFPDEVVFDTPKPETLLKRIFEIATNPGDLILDAYLGSGTSAATAHKLGRRYIGIERGEDAAKLSSARLKKVIQGEDGGVSKSINWNGGGGFSYLRFKS